MNSTTPVSYVLSADDELDDVEMRTKALKEAASGLEVLVADNGKSVLERLRKLRESDTDTPPCVLVMDMNMPKMDGRETVVAIKTDEVFKNLPILLFSTSINNTDELFADKWGVEFFQIPDSVQ